MLVIAAFQSESNNDFHPAKTTSRRTEKKKKLENENEREKERTVEDKGWRGERNKLD